MATQKLQVGRAFTTVMFSDNVDIPFPELSASGNATGGSLTTLQDSTANFVQGQINPGDIIYNMTTQDADIVVGINSPTEIKTAGYGGGYSAGQVYKIYAGQNNDGCVLYVGTGGDLIVETVGGDTVTLVNVNSGQFIPIQVKKIKIGSTAADILALW